MINVLFLCTGNSARSVLGEALLNHLGGDDFRGFSAGSDPAGKVQPLALEVLEVSGISTDGLSSKSWDEFMDPDKAVMQVVLTLCDDAASKPCPVWLGDGVRCHWGLSDPAAVTGDPSIRRAAFQHTLNKLKIRLQQLMALDQPLFSDSGKQTELRDALNNIHTQAQADE